jgi:hypothetical protein
MAQVVLFKALKLEPVAKNLSPGKWPPLTGLTFLLEFYQNTD